MSQIPPFLALINSKLENLLTHDFPEIPLGLFHQMTLDLLNNVSDLSLSKYEGASFELSKLKKKLTSIRSIDNREKKAFNDLSKLLFLFDSLYRQSARLSHELTDDFWDMREVEKHLEMLLSGFKDLFNQLKNKIPPGERVVSELIFAQTFIPPDIYLHPALIEFLIRKKEWAALKAFNPAQFKTFFKNKLHEIIEIPHWDRDEQDYYASINSLLQIESHLEKDQKIELQAAVYAVLSQATLSVTLFMRLYPLSSEMQREELVSLKFEQWKTSFLSSLKNGIAGQLLSSIADLLHPSFLAIMKKEIEKSPEVADYTDLFSAIKPEFFMKVGFWKFFEWSKKSRLSYLRSKNPPISLKLDDVFANIENTVELSISLKKLALLEHYIDHPDHHQALKQLKMIIALENYDLEEIKNLSREIEIEPWEKFENGDTLLEIAAKLTILQQPSFQNKLQLPKMKGSWEEFFYSLHAFTKEKLSKKPSKKPWSQIIEIINQTAFGSNEAMIVQKTTVFFGRWENANEVYTSLLKIYLPSADCAMWVKYCSKPSDVKDADWVEKWRRSSYKGSQAGYGIWFHLCSKAAEGRIQEKASWKEILHFLGETRKNAALFFSNIQIPKDHLITIGSRLQLEPIARNWPGSPLNFGIPIHPWEAPWTSLSIEQRSHYEKQIRELVDDFKQNFSKQLNKMESMGPFHRGQKFIFRDREFIVYPKVQSKDYTFVISAPFELNGKKVVGTHILWNWPAQTSFIYPGASPRFYDAEHVGMWVHASGSHKELMEAEIEKVFHSLLNSTLASKEFVKELAWFYYLFSQSMPFQRGTAAIGMILTNILLRRIGINPPDAMQSFQFLDCEAMCRTKEEFIQFFSSRIF